MGVIARVTVIPALGHVMRDAGHDDAGKAGHTGRGSMARAMALFSIVSPELPGVPGIAAVTVIP